jgi:hypothetical protein
LREPRSERPPEEIAVPIGFLTEAERERLDGFPAQVVPGDIETCFTLSRADRAQLASRHSLSRVNRWPGSWRRSP